VSGRRHEQQVKPFPDKARESKTWLSEDTGPITSLEQLLAVADYFGLTRDEAHATAGLWGMSLRVGVTSPLRLRWGCPRATWLTSSLHSNTRARAARALMR